MNKLFTSRLWAFIFLGIFYSPSIFSQNYFLLEDAKTLWLALEKDTTGKILKKFNKDKLDDIAPVIKKYFSDANNSDLVSSSLDNNPFLHRYASSVNKSGSGPGVLQKFEQFGDALNRPLPAPVSPPTPQLASLTTLVDGLGRFLAARAKAELTVAFFAKFRKELEKQKDLQLLFPTTYEGLKIVDEYFYTNQLSLLKDNFISDTENIWKNLETLLEKKFEAEENVDIPYYAFKTTFMVVSMLREDKHPAQVLSELTELPAHDNLNQDVRNSLMLAGVVSDAFRTADTAKVWIDAKEIDTLSTDLEMKYLFLGLLYERLKQLNDTFSIGDFKLIAGMDKLNSLEESAKDARLDSVFMDFGKLAKSFTERGGKSHHAMKGRDTLTFLDQTFEQIGLLGNLVKSSGKLMADLSGGGGKVAIDSMLIELDAYLDALDKGAELYRNIKAAQDTTGSLYHYVQAFVNAGELYLKVDFFLNNSTKNKKQKRKENRLRKDINEVANRIIYYGGFIARTLTAQSPEDVQKTLDAYLLPVGSYRAKHSRRFTLSLNAYVGGFLEFAKKDTVNKLGEPFFGINSPIGINASIKLGKREKRSSSLSLLVSVIDIGAVTAFRFNKNNDTLILPDITLRNIISPGGTLIWGIGNSPFCLGAGVQYNAALLKLVDNEFIISDKTGWNTRIFLAIDIPLLNIAKSRR